MTLAELQREMRGAYLWGAPGMITSGCVWLGAALAAQMGPPAQAVWVLFVGAALIHPVSIVVVRLLGASGKHSPGNALATLAMESTVCMIMSLPLAYGLSLFRREWFFPAVLLIIGGRYLVFHTIYGATAYWVAAAMLGLAAWAGFTLPLSPQVSALLGAIVEIAFGAVLLARSRSWQETERVIDEAS